VKRQEHAGSPEGINGLILISTKAIMREVTVMGRNTQKKRCPIAEIVGNGVPGFRAQLFLPMWNWKGFWAGEFAVAARDCRRIQENLELSV
jgi:hypothetical protein